MSLSVANLTKRFGNQVAVNDISFAVAENKVLGFLGPNGAGKSTTMKIIAGFILPSVGEIKLNNIDIAKYAKQAKQIIGYLPEHNPQYSDMYVLESLQFTAGIYGLHNATNRINEVMEMVGLSEERRKKIKQLSKGYKQRLGIAQAILHDPEVLILDEPTAGLDPNQLHEIRNLISSLGEEKIVVLSTHIMQEVEAVCEEVIIMNKGKLVANFDMAQVPVLFENETLEQVFARLTK